MEESFPNDTFNNIGAIIFYKKEIDINKLEKIFNIVLNNNDAFRIRIGYDNGKYYQYKGEYSNKHFKILNFKDDREGYEKWHKEHIKENLFKCDEELFRVTFVIRYDGVLASSVLVHHLIADAYSLVSIMYSQVLNYVYLDNIESKYNSYFDFLETESEYLNNSKRFLKGSLYWNEKFKNFSGENIYQGKISDDLQGGILTKDIGMELTEKINTFCKDNNITASNDEEGIAEVIEKFVI